MHVMVHWTINDLPSYTNLSGWATYGELAYPVLSNGYTLLQFEEWEKMFFY